MTKEDNLPIYFKFPPIEISMELVTFMEKETSDHKQNQMWKDLHIGRNTSSMFGDVLRWNSSQEYLVKQILDRGSLDRYHQLLKVKLWGDDMEDRARHYILNLNAADFYLEWGPTGPQLKRNQKCYAKVLGEIVVMGLPWCDFVVWTNAIKNNIFIEGTCFDKSFCNDHNDMLPKLLDFYMQCIYSKICE
ncbi:uncharacterized protein [Mytilus edulis]|uniref:uncharacterized protein n=1 Tax=Mytilus edulis TaxID=6550 RepID=UPI0039EE57FC